MGNVIKKISIFLCNLLWIVSCFPASFRFFYKMRAIKAIQHKKLLSIIHKNQTSVFGKEHLFKDITSYNDYKKNVPIQEYEHLSSYIKKIEEGQDNILTTEQVIILEPTSGSSGTKKYIPYTKSLKKEFQQAIAPWVFDIYSHYLKLFFTQSYWSISPQKEPSNNKKIIGFRHDSEYLSNISKWFMKQIMAVPQSFEKTKEMFKTNKNIGLISIWSPTFLNSIFSMDYNFTQKLKNIKFISAWGDATSSPFVSLIKSYFPKAIFQPKGIISTECFTSFPLCKLHNQAVLAYQSHFFEFIDFKRNVFLAHQLKKNREYTLIVTTSGGLYRYNTHDVIKVTGFYKNVPLIKFCGRDNQTSDFFGEKLNELFVQSACKNVFKKLKITPSFFVLTFYQNHYRLLIEGKKLPIKTLSLFLEKELEKNFHYKYCINLKQLIPVDCMLIQNATQKYIDFYQKKGIKLGDIKIKTLDITFNPENT